MNNEKETLLYMGRDIETLKPEELLPALRHMCRHIVDRQRNLSELLRKADTSQSPVAMPSRQFYVIQKGHCFWNKSEHLGWSSDITHATLFSEEEKESNRLPIDGVYVPYRPSPIPDAAI